MLLAITTEVLGAYIANHFNFMLQTTIQTGGLDKKSFRGQKYYLGYTYVAANYIISQ